MLPFGYELRFRSHRLEIEYDQIDVFREGMYTFMIFYSESICRTIELSRREIIKSLCLSTHPLHPKDIVCMCAKLIISQIHGEPSRLLNGSNCCCCSCSRWWGCVNNPCSQLPSWMFLSSFKGPSLIQSGWSGEKRKNIMPSDMQGVVHWGTLWDEKKLIGLLPQNDETCRVSIAAPGLVFHL